MKNRTVRRIFFLLCLSLAGFLLLCAALSPAAHAVGKAGVSKEARDFLTKLSSSLDEVAGVTKPSVVNVATTTIISMKDHPLGQYYNDPLFRRFFGFDLPEKFKESALGSGVIVSADGHILTNYHVVKNATEIKVTLFDKREFVGKVIGYDAPTDVAVIKVNAKGLPAAKIGDSRKLKAGDVVLAIGSPFGLGQTVTMGIVSAVGRANIGISDYENFIQTDAAINPGNSGGALVNASGELVGINTAIFSTSGGYMGVGFAIPADIANMVAQSIIKHGKVIRGWLGVSVQNITPDLAKYFRLTHDKGALVTDVVNGGPADKAGASQGDVIVEFNGQAVEDPADLRNIVANTAPGSRASMKVLRGKEALTLNVTVAEAPGAKRTARGASPQNVFGDIRVRALSPDIREGLNIPDNVNGVVVTDIHQESPAADVLAENDVIVEINRTKIKGLKSYEGVISKIGPSESAVILIYREGSYLYVTIRP